MGDSALSRNIDGPDVVRTPWLRGGIPARLARVPTERGSRRGERIAQGAYLTSHALSAFVTIVSAPAP